MEEMFIFLQKVSPETMFNLILFIKIFFFKFLTSAGFFTLLRQIVGVPGADMESRQLSVDAFQSRHFSKNQSFVEKSLKNH